MERKILINLILGTILCICLVGVAGASYTQKTAESHYIDPDTKQVMTEVRNQADKNANPENRLTILTGRALFDKGLLPNEYSAMVVVLSNYSHERFQNTYTKAAVVEDSVTYDNTSKTFTFILRLGEPSSDTRNTVKLTRTEFNAFALVVLDKGEEVFRRDKVNIHWTIQPKRYRP